MRPIQTGVGPEQMPVRRKSPEPHWSPHRPSSGYLPNNPKTIKLFQAFHGLVPDGIVGPKTRAVMARDNTTLGPAGPNDSSIKDFQRKHGLVADGIVGPKTRAVMRRLNLENL